MLINLAKTNVLGSQIYQTQNAERETRTSDEKRTTCIERPNILFDDLHSLWLLEFVKQIIGDFVHIAAPNRSVKTAIILDNSPGYVGIAPAIHGWLTDCGPIRGKFLTVTSLDAQDLRACERASDALHTLYKEKWKTSRLFVDRECNGDEICVAKDQEAFFMQLATAKPKTFRPDDPFAFYRPQTIEKVVAHQNAVNGVDFCAHPSKYLGAIVNRVPRAVKMGRLIYDVSEGPIKRDGTIGQLLGAVERGHLSRERMVSYDEYIENQFMLQSMQRGHRRSEHRLHRLIKSLEMSEHELQKGDRERSDDLDRRKRLDSANYELSTADILHMTEVVNRSRLAVDDAGFGHLARLIRDEWLPGSIVPGFRSALMGLLRESDFPLFEVTRHEVDPDLANSEMHDFVQKLKKHIMFAARESKMGHLIMADERTVDLLAGVLARLASLSLASSIWHTPFEMEIAELFAGVLAIELTHWKKRGQDHHGRYGIERFLAQESVNSSELEEEMMAVRKLAFLRHGIIRESDGGFSDFYKACTSAQARLLDCTADARFLVSLMVYIVKAEAEKRDIFPFVRGIADAVIVEKTLSHEEAPKQMAKALMAAEYYREFDGVLAKVLSDWGVANA